MLMALRDDHYTDMKQLKSCQIPNFYVNFLLNCIVLLSNDTQRMKIKCSCCEFYTFMWKYLPFSVPVISSPLIDAMFLGYGAAID